MYRIAGNIQGRKFRGSVGSENFAEKTFMECYIIHIHVGVWGMPNFVEKTFAGGSQGATMGKVIELPMHLRVKHMTLCKYIHVHVCVYTYIYMFMHVW